MIFENYTVIQSALILIGVFCTFLGLKSLQDALKCNSILKFIMSVICCTILYGVLNYFGLK